MYSVPHTAGVPRHVQRHGQPRSATSRTTNPRTARLMYSAAKYAKPVGCTVTQPPPGMSGGQRTAVDMNRALTLLGDE